MITSPNSARLRQGKSPRSSCRRSCVLARVSKSGRHPHIPLGETAGGAHLGLGFCDLDADSDEASFLYAWLKCTPGGAGAVSSLLKFRSSRSPAA